MKHRVARTAAPVTGGLLFGALVALQVTFSQKELLPFLLAYAVIAIAAILGAAVAEFPTSSIAGPWCLGSVSIFSGYIIARALTSPVVYAARADLYLVLAAFTVYALLVTVLNTPGLRIALVVALLLFALGHVVVSIAQGISGGSLSLLIPALEGFQEGRTAQRAAGLAVNPNHLAGTLEVLGALGFGIACWSRRPAWLRVCIGYLAASCYVGIALTGSRGGYLSVAASVIVFSLLSLMVLAASGGRRLLKFGAVGLIVGSLLGLGLWTLLQQNVTLTARLEKIAVDPGRLDLWRAAIDQWKLQPWIGTGSGTYLFYGREFRQLTMQQDPVDVHNDYLHLLAEYGIVGAAAFLLFFTTHLGRGVRTFFLLGVRRVREGAPPLSDRLGLNLGALSAVAAYVVHSAVDYNLHIPANALLVAVVFGIIAAPGFVVEWAEPSTFHRRAPRIAVGLFGAMLLIACARILPGEYFADRARVALWEEDADAAVEAGLKALEYERQNPKIYFYLGRALRASAADLTTPEEQRPFFEAAISAMAAAQRVAPLDATYALEQATLYGRLGRFEEAERMFAIARERDPRASYIAEQYRAHQELRKKHNAAPAAEAAPGG